MALKVKFFKVILINNSRFCCWSIEKVLPSEECNHKTKKTKMKNLINDKLEGISPVDETENCSDNDSKYETESDNEKDNDESSE